MKTKEIEISADLQIFIKKFEPNKFKLMAKGIEIRGIKWYAQKPSSGEGFNWTTRT